jgi:hypothetical protein
MDYIRAYHRIDRGTPPAPFGPFLTATILILVAP